MGRPLKRITVQLLLTIPAALLLISLLTELTSWIVKGRSVPLSFYLIDVFISASGSCINGIISVCIIIPNGGI